MGALGRHGPLGNVPDGLGPLEKVIDKINPVLLDDPSRSHINSYFVRDPHAVTAGYVQLSPGAASAPYSKEISQGPNQSQEIKAAEANGAVAVGWGTKFTKTSPVPGPSAAAPKGP